MKKNLIVVISIFILGFVIYANALHNGFVYDDDFVVKNNLFLTSWNNLSYFFTPVYFSASGESSYRPVVTLTYLIDYKLGKGTPFFFHLSNVFLHVLTSILFYFFTLSFISKLDGHLPLRKTSFLAVLFFLLHPIQTEAVNGISFREDILAAFFCLFSLFFYLKSKYTKGRNFSFFYSGSLFFFFLAFLSKETAFSLIFIILAMDLFLETSHPVRIYNKIIYGYVGYFLVICLYSYIRFFGMVNLNAPLGAFKGVGYLGGSLYTAMLTMSRIFAAYLKLIFFPARLSVEHYFQYFVDPSLSIFEPRVLFSVFVFLAVLIGLIYSFRKYKIFAFCGLWFFFFLLPVSNILPLDHSMAERYLYLPCAGFCVFLAGLLVKLFYFSRGRIFRNITAGIIIFILLFYGLRTAVRNKEWKDDLTLLSKERDKKFVSERVYTILGNAYSRKGLLDEAIEQYIKAIEVRPDYVDAYNNLGNRYLDKGLSGKAVEYYQQAIHLDPLSYYAYNNLGSVYFRKGELDKSLKCYQKVLELNPYVRDAYYNLGMVYCKKKLYNKAAQTWSAVLKIDPNYSLAVRGLTQLHDLGYLKE